MEFKFSVKPYENTFHGGVRVATGDLNCDGLPDLVTTPAGGRTATVKIFNGTPDINGNYPAAQVASFDAYPTTFRGGSAAAVGDVNGDGANDLVTAPGRGMASQIRVYDGDSVLASRSLLTAPFYAFAATFRGGVNLAIGDIDRADNKGYAEIVTAVAQSTPGTVNVFELNDANTAFERRLSFQAFDRSYKGGIFVAVGDYSGDGIRDIIASAGPGRTPTVRVFEGIATNNQILENLPATATTVATAFRSFNAYAPNYRGGVTITAKEYDDGYPGSVGKAELFMGYAKANRARNLRRTTLDAAVVDALFASTDFSAVAFLG